MSTWNKQFNNQRYEGSTTFISPRNKFFSQYNQDRSLKNCIFKEYQNGIFVDVGAHDGVDLNNTLFFETNYNWRGINIEPINSVYNRLVTNRPKCININCAVSDTDGFAEFVCNEGYTEMLSGLKSEYDDRHLKRISDENKITGSKSQVINIQTKRLETICKENNINHINYLSIDVEGGEFKVINSINFDTLFIDVIGFENNYHDMQDICINYLKNKGYLKLPDHLADTFMIHKESKFLKDVNLN